MTFTIDKMVDDGNKNCYHMIIKQRYDGNKNIFLYFVSTQIIIIIQIKFPYKFCFIITPIKYY